MSTDQSNGITLPVDKNIDIGGSKDIGYLITQARQQRDVISSTGVLTLKKVGSAAASASGLLMGVGTTAAPAATATADEKFVEIRAKSTASSGDNRLMYLRYDLDGGGGGECIRAMTELGTADVGTARGAHISLEVTGGTAECTGLGVGLDAQINIEAGALTHGTYAVLNSEIYSGAASSDPGGQTISHLRCVNGGNAAGKEDVDDDALLLEISGYTAGAGHLFDSTIDTTSPQIDHTLKIKLPDGSLGYIGVMDNANGS